MRSHLFGTFLRVSFLMAISISYLKAQQENIFTNAELESFQKAANTLVYDTTLTIGDVGILVQDAATAKTLCSYNSKKSLIPASNQKIIVTATALKIL